jgi:hypothetical protein
MFGRDIRAMPFLSDPGCSLGALPILQLHHELTLSFISDWL